MKRPVFAFTALLYITLILFTSPGYARNRITVTSPNGGEQWGEGLTVGIQWISGENVSEVKIEYSTDNGTSWKPIAGSVDALAGVYHWRVPSDYSEQCLVRITDTASQSYDVSDDVFAIIMRIYISIVEPNGGETMQGGTSYRIWWGRGHVERVDISYSIDDGATWVTVAENYDATVGDYQWDVPSVYSTSALVRLTDSEKPELSDTSQFTFTILPSVFIESPDPGQRLIAGSTHEITWSFGVDANTAIHLSTDGGETWRIIAENIKTTDESTAWHVPVDYSDNCLLKFCDTEYPGICYGTSIGAFTITGHRLVVSVNFPSFGSVTVDPEGETLDDIPADVSKGYLYPDGAAVSLTATPLPGFLYDSIKGSIESSKNPNHLVMDSDKNVEIMFVRLNALTFHVSTTGDDVTGDGSPERPYGTIIRGIEEAIDGDTVLLEDGVYTGEGNKEFYLNGKAITLKSENGAETCIVDGQGRGRGFYTANGETERTIIDGITFRDFWGDVSHVISGSGPVIRNCIFADNKSPGGELYCGHGATPRIENCIFHGNKSGLSFTRGCNAVLYNVIIYDTYIPDVEWGEFHDWAAVYCLDSEVTIINSIIWNNKYHWWIKLSADWDVDEGVNNASLTAAGSTVRILYSDIEGGAEDILTSGESTVTWDGSNIVSDPLFVDPENSDFHLDNGSPCIGTGQFELDMGAYPGEHIITGVRAVVPRNIVLANFPNPFNPRTTIEYSMIEPSNVLLTVHNITGQRVAILKNGFQQPGSHSVSWDASSMPSGIYFCTMQTGGYTKTKKMLLLK